MRLKHKINNDPQRPWQRLDILRVFTSKSKAENVNAALEHITSPLIAVFDADHWPEPQCFDIASRIMRSDPACTTIQGKVRACMTIVPPGLND